MFDRFKLITIASIAVMLLASYAYVAIHYYRTGYNEASKAYDEALAKTKESHQNNLLATERAMQEKQNSIISEYLHTIDVLEKQHDEDQINLDNLRDAIDVKLDSMCRENNSGRTAVSTKATNQSSLKCYSRTDIQRKIEQSLAVGKECDKLAIKYNSLLEWCKHENIE